MTSTEWDNRVKKKRGPPKGTPLPGRPLGRVVKKGKPVPMSMGEIVLKFWS